jgi:ATP adenylyltransferase
MTNRENDVKRIWAPWRYRYVASEKVKDCVFCQLAQDGSDEENLVLYRGRLCYVCLNRYPYTNGHLMVIPYQHTDSPLNLPAEALAELMALDNMSIFALSEAMHPDGFNTGMNIGKAAGAGIQEHVHLHVVPRWNGDNNYMAVVSETRVISQALAECYASLVPVFARLANKAK